MQPDEIIVSAETITAFRHLKISKRVLAAKTYIKCDVLYHHIVTGKRLVMSSLTVQMTSVKEYYLK